MKILWVKADKLLPVQRGGNIRTFHIARALASKHELTFYSYYGGHRDESYEAELRKQLPGAVAVCTGKHELSGAARGIDYLLHLAAEPPYAVSRFACFKVQDELRKWFKERRFDVAVCDFLDAAINFPGRLTIPSVLFQHNVESEIWRRHSETTKNPLKRAMYQMEFGKMLRYETVSVRKFHHVIAVSENDRSLMNRWVDASRVTVVPTGVDLEQYRPASRKQSAAPVVTFVGAMDWEPNVDGVEYFCTQIWPAVKAEIPEARLRFVGRNPDRRVQKWVSDSIEVTGRVPSVLEHLHDSAVVIVPLRIGGGTRLKIYEAMAAGKAVVSTTIGAEGLDVRNGKDIVLADDANAFAQAVILLLRDQELRQRYEKAAAETAAQFGWPAIGDQFSDILRSVVERKSKATAIPASRT
jgi:glycosyltransferase involved in cell wall biosynthesis